MNRCDVIDLLEDKYGLNKDELSKRELAIIGLCTNELADDEEQELNLRLVSNSVCPKCDYPKFKKYHEDFERCNGCDWTSK